MTKAHAESDIPCPLPLSPAAHSHATDVPPSPAAVDSMTDMPASMLPAAHSHAADIPPSPAAAYPPVTTSAHRSTRTSAAKQWLLSIFFPRRCPVCEEIVSPRGALICPDCERQLHFLTEPTCQICGREILADDEELCENCKRHRFLFKRSIALVGYDDVAARSISRIKYTGAREFLDYYGREAVRRRGDELRRMQIDAIVPVPVHPSRKRKRGYNQATVLAEVMGAELGLPVYEAALYRRKKTAASKELNAAERLKNLMSAFYAGPIPQDLRRVLLVDDIFTTGATMESCTRILLAAGVEEVYCFALAIRSER